MLLHVRDARKRVPPSLMLIERRAGFFISIAGKAAEPPALQAVLWDNTIDEGRSSLARQ
jgi:hypothetical protein